MQIKDLNRIKSAEAMNEWIEGDGTLQQVSSDYLSLRKTIETIYALCQNSDKDRNDYKTDVQMGLGIYDYLSQQKGFSLRAAANDNFWRYVSLIVAPHIVAERWGKDNADHYWRIGSRIWYRQLWWYVHLSWQGDLITTKDVLESNNFSTDTILNLAERTGRYGTYIDVYRYIMYYYSILDKTEIEMFESRIKKYDKHATLFRAIMKLNTAKTLVIDPAFYLGGENEFAKSLYREVGINI